MALAVQVHNDIQPPSPSSLREEALAGFAATPKYLSPKFFYDRRGSELFEQICQQPEYYLTRTEEGILAEVSVQIRGFLGPGCNLIELGSGASRKVRLLLERLRPASYLGIDISEEFLLHSTRRLAADYPWLEVHAACTDFSQQLQLPADFPLDHPLVFFPGSSIGNYTPDQAGRLLSHLHDILPAGGGLLIGVDLLKDKAILEAAYNDRAQVTAAFNLNLLYRMHRELRTDLEPTRFVHHAFFNEAHSRIEMHLVSRVRQTVTLEGRKFRFNAGESLHSENSYKYSLHGFTELADGAGFNAAAHWTDAGQLFSVHYLQRRP